MSSESKKSTMSRVRSFFTSSKAKAKKALQIKAAKDQREEELHQLKLARERRNARNNEDARIAALGADYQSERDRAEEETRNRLLKMTNGGRRRTRHIKRKTHKRRRTIHNRR